jgi:hypothetical protein
MKTKKCSVCLVRKDLKNFYECKTKLYSMCFDCSKKKSRDWYLKNKETHNRRSSERYRLIRNELFNLLGNECCQCGIQDYRVFSIDHVGGGGKKHRSEKGVGTGFMYRILREIKNESKKYQILCLNCNRIKAIENNEIKYEG